MTRTDTAIHDLAVALSSLGPNVKNREQIFVRSLESLVRFAISEKELERVRGARDDMKRVGEILARSKSGAS